MWACEQVAPCFTLRDKKRGGGRHALARRAPPGSREARPRCHATLPIALPCIPRGKKKGGERSGGRKSHGKTTVEGIRSFLLSQPRPPRRRRPPTFNRPRPPPRRRPRSRSPTPAARDHRPPPATKKRDGARSSSPALPLLPRLRFLHPCPRPRLLRSTLRTPRPPSRPSPRGSSSARPPCWAPALSPRPGSWERSRRLTLLQRDRKVSLPRHAARRSTLSWLVLSTPTSAPEPPPRRLRGSRTGLQRPAWAPSSTTPPKRRSRMKRRRRRGPRTPTPPGTPRPRSSSRPSPRRAPPLARGAPRGSRSK